MSLKTEKKNKNWNEVTTAHYKAADKILADMNKMPHVDRLELLHKGQWPELHEPMTVDERQTFASDIKNIDKEMFPSSQSGLRFAAILNCDLDYFGPYTLKKNLFKGHTFLSSGYQPCYGQLLGPVPTRGVLVKNEITTRDSGKRFEERKPIIKEFFEAAMSEKSPWWPLPKYTDILTTQADGTPELFLVHNCNVPACLLVNWLIAFRCWTFDVRVPETIVEMRKWYGKNKGEPLDILKAFALAGFFSIPDTSAPDGDGTRLYWRQHNFPVTGSPFGNVSTPFSMRKFVEQRPSHVTGHAFARGSGIPNNLIWEGQHKRYEIPADIMGRTPTVRIPFLLET